MLTYYGKECQEGENVTKIRLFLLKNNLLKNFFYSFPTFTIVLLD